MGKLTVLGWLLILICFSASAQQGKEYSFTHYTTSDGLASNFVNNVVQDKSDFIWLGTANGLQRYDGYKFIAFRHQKNNASSIPSNNISCYIDKKENLWIETDARKAGIFNTSNFTYTDVPIHWKDAVNNQNPRSFFEEEDGQLYLVIFLHGIYRYDEKLNAFVPSDNTIPLPQKWRPVSITQQPSTNYLWIACDSGLVMINKTKGTASYRGHNVENNPVINRYANDQFIGTINFEQNKNWISFVNWPPLSGNPFVHWYNLTTGEALKFDLGKDLNIGYHEIVGSLKQKNGHIWYYGRSFVCEYDITQKKFIPTIKNNGEHGIRFETASRMFEDKLKSIWICTDNGLFLFNPDAQLFNNYSLTKPDGKGPIIAPTQKILQLSNGQIWVGCWGKGLYCYDNNFNPLPLPKGFPKEISTYGSSVWDIAEDTINKRVWLGCQGGYLVVYDLGTARTEILQLEIFGRRTIRQVLQDNEGNMWFGTQNGMLIKWNHLKAENKITKGYELVDKSSQVTKLFKDNDGSIWVATNGMGLKKVDPHTNRIIKTYNTAGGPQKSLWNDAPSDILRFDDSTIFIANNALCILNSKTGKISFFTEEDGLPSNNIVSLQKDKQNALWLGMLNGLLRMNVAKQKMSLFDRREGILFDYFNPAQAFSLRDGRLAYTTDHNFLVFDPAGMMDTSTPPDVQITAFRAGNQFLSLDSLKKSGKIVLPYDNTSFTIDFSEMAFVNSFRITYQLEPLDKDWKRADERRQVIYSYLPPGNYTFKVKCESGDGVQSRQISTLNIIVRSPFWKTWWFYAILALLVIAVFYWIYRERLKSIIELQKVRTQIANSLHEDISSTLNNIHLLGEMAKIKADSDIDRSKEYITQISNKSYNMMSAMDDMLWSINPDNDNMGKTLLRMRELAEALKNRYQINMRMEVDEKIKSQQLDMKSRHEFFLLFKDLLSKMFDHSNGSEILINVDLARQKISMKLQDNGSYQSPAAVFSDTDLPAMQKRADALNAILDIHTDSKGVAVILLIQVD